MKHLMLVALIAALAAPAYADSASHDWNSSEGFPSDSANANRFNAAQTLWLLANGGATTNVTNNTSNTTNCTIQAACMYGGEVSNLNGVTATTISNSSGVTVGNNVQTSDTQQNGAAIPIAGTVHTITFH